MQSVPGSVSVQTAVTPIVGYSESRTSLILENVGANVVAIGVNPDVTLSNGPLRLTATAGAGGNRLMLGKSEFPAIVRGPIYGIASGGASVVGFVEGF